MQGNLNIQETKHQQDSCLTNPAISIRLFPISLRHSLQIITGDFQISFVTITVKLELQLVLETSVIEDVDITKINFNICFKNSTYVEQKNKWHRYDGYHHFIYSTYIIAGTGDYNTTKGAVQIL
ncbi:hypothetical protein AVEN_246981-1, partial [Araneus ventricosus]